MEPIAFMIHKGDNQISSDIILEKLKEYDIGDYIIAQENKPYTHWHIYIQMDIKDYNAFVAKTLRKEWKLRGRATGGAPKQYGRVQGIKKPDKMIAYTIKQGIYISSYSEEHLQPFKDMAFTKDRATNDRDFKKKVLEDLDKQFTEMLLDSEFKFTDKYLLKTIIKYHLNNKIDIRTKSYLDGILRYVRQYSSFKKVRIEDPEYFYLQLYGNF